MAREIQVNEPTASKRRLFFHLVGTDGITPALAEAGGQPQISSDGAAWTNTGIGVLVAVGNGRYYADLTVAVVATVGTAIETRYKSAATAECPGDSAVVVEEVSSTTITLTNNRTPEDTPMIVASRLRGFTKDVVLLDANSSTVVALSTDKLRAYIGREGEMGDDLADALFLITSDTDSAAGSYFRKNSPSSGTNRLRVDATDLDFAVGIYTLYIDFYDGNDAGEWKAVSRDVFVLED